MQLKDAQLKKGQRFINEPIKGQPMEFLYEARRGSRYLARLYEMPHQIFGFSGDEEITVAKEKSA